MCICVMIQIHMYSTTLVQNTMFTSRKTSLPHPDGRLRGAPCCSHKPTVILQHCRQHIFQSEQTAAANIQQGEEGQITKGGLRGAGVGHGGRAPRQGGGAGLTDLRCV